MIKTVKYLHAMVYVVALAVFTVATILIGMNILTTLVEGLDPQTLLFTTPFAVITFSLMIKAAIEFDELTKIKTITIEEYVRRGVTSGDE